MTKMTGFSLYELLVVCALLSILIGMAMPACFSWRKEAEYRATARAFLGALREARQRAITTMLEHRVEFDLDNGRYRMTHGDRANNSSAASWDQNVVYDWDDFPPEVLVRSLSTCSKSTGMENIHLNPNGTSSSRYVCVMNWSVQRKFRVGVPYSTTGKAVIKRWNPATDAWE
ncbi:MAG: hypothetical protein P8X63_03385 [Desulfuromonadaceae bacterium]